MRLQVIKKHWDILKRGHKITVLYGGTRSGKTYSILQYLFVEAMRGSFRLASVVSRSFSHIKRGALREFQAIISPVYWLIEENKTFLTYKFPTGAVVEFFSADTEEKLRGPQRDWLFVNEVNLLTQEEFAQLFMRTKDRVFLDFNPVGRFWLDDFLENNPSYDYIIAKSTYKDNPFLSESQRKAIESLAYMDERLYRVYALGERLDYQGRALMNYEIVEPSRFTDIMASSRPIIGVDFGFSHAETAAVAVWVVGGKELLVKEIFYRKGQAIKELAEAIKQYEYEAILADYSQLQMIEALADEGLDYVNRCRKIDLRQSFALLNMYRLYITADSPNLINEATNLYWKDERTLADSPNHLIDALRYVVHYLYL
jgi:phage terminase large subunit